MAYLPPAYIRIRPGRPPRPWRGAALSLLLVAALAGWVIVSLLLALLGQPAESLSTLHARGTRGVPAVVWAGSRDLVSWLRPNTDLVRHD